MLLWDWPNIKKGVTSLKDSRLKGIYIEVAPSTKVCLPCVLLKLKPQGRTRAQIATFVRTIFLPVCFMCTLDISCRLLCKQYTCACIGCARVIEAARIAGFGRVLFLILHAYIHQMSKSTNVLLAIQAKKPWQENSCSLKWEKNHRAGCCW
jgi:hypothetical protein